MHKNFVQAWGRSEEGSRLNEKQESSLYVLLLKMLEKTRFQIRQRDPTSVEVVELPCVMANFAFGPANLISELRIAHIVVVLGLLS